MSFKSFGDEIEFLYQFGVIPALKGLVCNLSAIGDVRYRVCALVGSISPVSV